MKTILYIVVAAFILLAVSGCVVALRGNAVLCTPDSVGEIVGNKPKE
jgi:hypothetical protein